MINCIVKGIAAVALSLTAVVGFAHTTVSSTSPASGSVLQQSPARIEIRFRDHARLTSVMLAQAGKPDRRLDFSPKDSATVFTVLNPNLPTGRNEIQWKALSMDGHVVSGTLVLTVKDAAKPAS